MNSQRYDWKFFISKWNYDQRKKYQSIHILNWKKVGLWGTLFLLLLIKVRNPDYSRIMMTFSDPPVLVWCRLPSRWHHLCLTMCKISHNEGNQIVGNPWYERGVKISPGLSDDMCVCGTKEKQNKHLLLLVRGGIFPYMFFSPLHISFIFHLDFFGEVSFGETAADQPKDERCGRKERRLGKGKRD